MPSPTVLYQGLPIGPLHSISVRIVARSHGVVGAASPVQLKPWTKPDLVQVGGVVLTTYVKPLVLVSATTQ
ncbi:hypothetical protein TIFTF001_042484 [Ficus carica]|uniref:Uncharacterized protein n=1 Tax=Ficus carica TaxID=3494 RepID=A0AA88CVR9_FICCA|nr:hypothetical protein TIFTF001_042484 [Ficus carica]